MFRLVVAIIRSLSFDTLKIIYIRNCVAACLMTRSLHQGLCRDLVIKQAATHIGRNI